MLVIRAAGDVVAAAIAVVEGAAVVCFCFFVILNPLADG